MTQSIQSCRLSFVPIPVKESVRESKIPRKIAQKRTQQQNQSQRITMRVDISVHASKLKNVAGAFKGTSDPYAVVTEIATTPGETPKVLGKTEV